MKATLLGGEIEYAMGATNSDGRGLPQRPLLRSFIDFARGTLPYTSISSWGRFLTNGGLLYLDAGLHLEWASPECSSPHDVVRYLKAGDCVVQGLAGQFRTQSQDVADVFVTRCNVDYLEPTLWASHESYLHTTPPDTLPAQLIPFLTSRVVVCGAGGWDYRSPGLSFTLSPRACFISEVVADDTQHVRPIFHTKHEGLSHTGTHRLHVGCSETLCSDLATLLRFGTTALVVAAIDDGGRPGDSVKLVSPLAAIRHFAADPGCTVRARLATGRRLTAVEIQRHYLEVVEQRLGGSGMPEWAESVAALWRQALDDLETGTAQLAQSFDWAIKQRVFAEFLNRRGIAWSSLPVLNDVLAQVTRWLVAHGKTLSTDAVLAEDTPIAATPPTSRLARKAWASTEITREKLATLLRLREEAFELDMRFGQLGPRGIFDSLDRAGVLKHRVAGVDAIDAAVDTPPTGTRATIRGEVVRRLTKEKTHYRAEWTRIVDVDHHRVLDLGDPFETEERWSSLGEIPSVRRAATFSPASLARD